MQRSWRSGSDGLCIDQRSSYVKKWCQHAFQEHSCASSALVGFFCKSLALLSGLDALWSWRSETEALDFDASLIHLLDAASDVGHCLLHDLGTRFDHLISAGPDISGWFHPTWRRVVDCIFGQSREVPGMMGTVQSGPFERCLYTHQAL